MKKMYFFIGLSISCVLFAVYQLTGQVPDFPAVETLTPDNIFVTAVDPLYTGLVILSGYLTSLIPGLNKFKPFLRVISFAAVAGLGFYLFGGASIWKVALSYLLASGLYVSVFKTSLQAQKPNSLLPPADFPQNEANQYPPILAHCIHRGAMGFFLF